MKTKFAREQASTLKQLRKTTGKPGMHSGRKQPPADELLVSVTDSWTFSDARGKHYLPSYMF